MYLANEITVGGMVYKAPGHNGTAHTIKAARTIGSDTK
jgi:hypothetical protein